MKLGILSKVLIFIIICSLLSNPFCYEKNNKVVKNLQMSNYSKSNNNIIYKNEEHHTVNLSTNNIKIVCNGKYVEDEKLVKNNLKINTIFKTNSITKYNSIDLKEGEIVYINLSDEYLSDVLPINEVKCDYQVNITIQ